MPSNDVADRSNLAGADADAEAARERVLLRDHVGGALSSAGFGDVLVLSHEQADRVLTPARREIIEVLSTTPVGSLRDLADRLDRDPGNLSRDLQVLVAENVVRYVQDGRAKRPELKHQTIVQEPLVAVDDPLPESE